MMLRVHDVQSLSEERVDVRKRNAALLLWSASKFGDTTVWSDVNSEETAGAVPWI